MSKELSLKDKILSKKTLVSFVIAFIVLFLLFHGVDFSKTIYIIKSINPLIYLLAFPVYYLSYPSRGLRWKILLDNIGIRGTIRDLTEILFISWSINCIVPAKLGDVYRGYLTRKNYGNSISKVMGSIFVERVYDIIVLIILLGISSLLVFGKYIPKNILILLEMGYGLIGLIIILIILMKHQRNRLEKLLPAKLKDIFIKFEKGTSQSLDKKTIPIIVIYTVFIWFFEIGRLFIVTKSLGLNISSSIIVFVALAAQILTALPLTPAGLGIVEASIAGVLILVGVDKNIAVSIAILDRLISYWSLMILGGITYSLSDKV